MSLKMFEMFLEFLINVLLISMPNFISTVIFVSSATIPLRRGFNYSSQSSSTVSTQFSTGEILLNLNVLNVK